MFSNACTSWRDVPVPANSRISGAVLVGCWQAQNARVINAIETRGNDMCRINTGRGLAGQPHRGIGYPAPQ
jgi:hypothetical protein